MIMMGAKTVQRNVSRTVLVIMITGITWQADVYAATYDSIKNDFSTNINDPSGAAYGLDSIRPIADSTLTMNVTLDWNLVSINDFDETNGYMDVSGFVTMEWIADGYSTTVVATDSIRPNLLWKPPIVLLNSVKSYEVIGHDSSMRIKYNFQTKECQWKPWVVARAACSPDVKYYPFDKQSCDFRLSVWGYKTNEVSLTSSTNSWGFLYFEENGEWKIDDTSVEASVINEFSVIDFKMKLTRRPLYYVINLIAPVLLLGALSACTFLLPIESGERIGFSVTCFLSYVVLLNTIMEFLPSSGLPLSYLSYYTFVMMIFSAVISVLSIVTIRIYHKSEKDPVPEILTYFFQCLTCRLRCCNNSGARATDKVEGPDTASTSWDSETIDTVSASWDNESLRENDVPQSSDTLSQRTGNKEGGNITWKDIAAFVDIFLFLSFLGGQLFYSIAYLIPIFVN